MNTIESVHAAHVVLSEDHRLSPEDHATHLGEAREHLAGLLPENATLEDLEADALAASEERSRLLAEHPAEARALVLEAMQGLQKGEALSSEAHALLDERLTDHAKAHREALEALDARELALHHANLVGRLDGLLLAQAEAELEAEGVEGVEEPEPEPEPESESEDAIADDGVDGDGDDLEIGEVQDDVAPPGEDENPIAIDEDTDDPPVE